MLEPTAVTGCLAAGSAGHGLVFGAAAGAAADPVTDGWARAAGQAALDAATATLHSNESKNAHM